MWWWWWCVLEVGGGGAKVGLLQGAEGQKRETEGGESFITVDSDSALRAAGAAGTLTFLSFH